MAHLLIVYGTSYGQTERICQRLATAVENQGHKVTLRKADRRTDDLELRGFGAVVIAASVIRGRHQRYIRQFARKHAGELNQIPMTGFLSVCNAAGDAPEEAGKYVDAFLRETGLQPAVVRSFAGALAYTRYGFLTRWIMIRISRSKAGPTDTTRDHDLTDWKAVDQFGLELARKLQPSTAHPGAHPPVQTVQPVH